jgi:hypothetical protein
MRLLVPAAVVVLIVVAYVFFYTIGATESQGTTSLGLANAVGLVGVLVALIAAGFILRRGAPPANDRDTGNP